MTKVDWLAADVLQIPMIKKCGVEFATSSAKGKQGPTVDQ